MTFHKWIAWAVVDDYENLSTKSFEGSKRDMSHEFRCPLVIVLASYSRSLLQAPSS